MIKRKAVGYTLINLPVIALWAFLAIKMGILGTVYFLGSLFITAGIVLCVYVGTHLVID